VTGGQEGRRTRTRRTGRTRTRRTGRTRRGGGDWGGLLEPRTNKQKRKEKNPKSGTQGHVVARGGGWRFNI